MNDLNLFKIKKKQKDNLDDRLELYCFKKITKLNVIRIIDESTNVRLSYLTSSNLVKKKRFIVEYKNPNKRYVSIIRYEKNKYIKKFTLFFKNPIDMNIVSSSILQK